MIEGVSLMNEIHDDEIFLMILDVCSIYSFWAEKMATPMPHNGTEGEAFITVYLLLQQ